MSPHRYDPTCGCIHCDPSCPACGAPWRFTEECGECGWVPKPQDGRERGDDDGMEYGDPRETMEER